MSKCSHLPLISTCHCTIVPAVHYMESSHCTCTPILIFVSHWHCSTIWEWTGVTIRTAHAARWGGAFTGFYNSVAVFGGIHTSSSLGMGWWQSENTHEATCAVVPRSHILYVLYLNLHNLVLYPKYHSVLYQSTYIRVLGLSLSSPRKMYTNSLLRHHLVFSAPRNASRLILSCRIWNLGLKYDYICIQWTWKGII